MNWVQLSKRVLTSASPLPRQIGTLLAVMPGLAILYPYARYMADTPNKSAIYFAVALGSLILVPLRMIQAIFVFSLGAAAFLTALWLTIDVNPWLRFAGIKSGWHHAQALQLVPFFVIITVFLGGVFQASTLLSLRGVPEALNIRRYVGNFVLATAVVILMAHGDYGIWFGARLHWQVPAYFVMYAALLFIPAFALGRIGAWLPSLFDRAYTQLVGDMAAAREPLLLALVGNIVILLACAAGYLPLISHNEVVIGTLNGGTAFEKALLQSFCTMSTLNCANPNFQENAPVVLAAFQSYITLFFNAVVLAWAVSRMTGAGTSVQPTADAPIPVAVAPSLPSAMGKLPSRVWGWLGVLSLISVTALGLAGAAKELTAFESYGRTQWALQFGNIMLAIALIRWAWAHARHNYGSRWYGPPPGYPISWEEVTKLLGRDPIMEHDDGGLLDPFCRGGPWVRAITEIAIAAIVVAFFGVWVAYVHGTPAIRDELIKFKDFTVVFAFAGIVITALIATIQLRAKVRSDNRQNWIAALRKPLAEMIRLIPVYGGEFVQAHRNPSREKFAANNFELELYLNPSEKTHRALIAMVHKAYWDTPDQEPYEPIEIDRVVLERLGKQALLANETERAALKSEIIRLSNVVLKREWELVKRAQ